MKFGSKPARSLVANPNRQQIHIIDQTQLPFSMVERTLSTWQDVAEAITAMRVRGAPLIGVTAAYGVALAMSIDASDANLRRTYESLIATRPTAVNLAWALKRITHHLQSIEPAERHDAAWLEAAAIEAEDVATNLKIGQHGLQLLRALYEKHQRPINILTHCNAGRMACVAWGTATAPIYLAHQEGLHVHVWVEETRPRNQGLITQWELHDADVPHTCLVDNAGGHLMQHGKVDIVLVGADRVTARGDVANKIGTYLKALAAFDNNIPFYAAVPTSTIDLSIDDGVKEIEIEERAGSEIRSIRGLDRDGLVSDLTILQDSVNVTNPGFDVTPARLVTGIITERGIAAPSALKAFLSS
jgi:methylthioribose-1-phosphate isomerase